MNDVSTYTDTRGPQRFGLAVVIVFLLGFGAWAGLAPLKSAAIADGQVAMSGKNRKVQHLDGGIIGAIEHREGDAVYAGQLLYRLESTQLESQLAATRAQLDAALAEQARLRAERDADNELVFPLELAERVEQERVAELLVTQDALFEQRRTTLAGQMEVMAQRVAALEEEIKGLEAQRDAASEQARLLQREIDNIDKLVKQGMAKQAETLSKQGELARRRGDFGDYVARIAKARQKIAETRLQAMDLRNRRLEEVGDALGEADGRIAELREQLRSQADKLARLEIRAPVDGVLANVVVNTIGQVVQPGETLLDVVPSDEAPIVEARLRRQDIDEIRVGLEAEVRLTSYNLRQTPNLQGRLVFVSADAVSDPHTGESYYPVRIELDATPDGIELRAGMPAEAMIATGEGTMMDYLLSPLLDAVRRSMRES
ncbi:MAG: HlyD family type I secretion periplasmic adaptor subunit [Gammaproteobacteria bacterium]|nr:HlyD family type I secretion periplasmic adaptor subunit [Gammaproteobacteria bacterium]